VGFEPLRQMGPVTFAIKNLNKCNIAKLMMSFQLIDKQKLTKKDNSFKNSNSHINKPDYYKYNKQFAPAMVYVRVVSLRLLQIWQFNPN
jgi:hypothetical protein